ncbi:MAG: hypothetical protein KME06_10250 [Kastovskya adunca ATA6-11-RM4]|jgi:hypothetical protein|nr:hypothetical protein [Kastovskya adunca ATA6-11-RM4]
MKLITFVMATVLILLCWVAPSRAENPAPTKQGSGGSQEQLQPLKTYFLNVLPGGGRQFIKFVPPVTKLLVSSQSGDTTIRFGSKAQAYISKPGNPQEVSADISCPIQQLWAENPHEKPVRLRVDVYAASSPTESAPTLPNSA